MCHDGWDQVEIGGTGVHFKSLRVLEPSTWPPRCSLQVVRVYVLKSGVHSNDGCAAWKCKTSRVVDVSCVVQVMSPCRWLTDVVHGDKRMPTKCVANFHAEGVTSHLWGRLA
jgi:hypothetical protein